jgi:hypothetical protein
MAVAEDPADLDPAGVFGHQNHEENEDRDQQTDPRVEPGSSGVPSRATAATLRAVCRRRPVGSNRHDRLPMPHAATTKPNSESAGASSERIASPRAVEFGDGKRRAGLSPCRALRRSPAEPCGPGKSSLERRRKAGRLSRGAREVRRESEKTERDMADGPLALPLLSVVGHIVGHGPRCSSAR